MPIVNIKGIGQVRFPDTMSQQAIIGAIENDIIPQHEARIKPAESMRESLVGGANRGLSSIRTAISAPFDGGQEAGLAGLERQKAIEEKPGASLDYLKYIHETQGPWAAAKELAAQTPRAIAEQVPNLAAMGAGAKAGAMAGARLPLPPQGRAIASLLGGGLGAFGTSFGPQAGANIERQAQEGKQVDLASAYGTAIPQAGIDVATAALALGKGFGKMLGIDSRLLGTPQAEALAVQKLAQESKKMAVAKGTVKMATLEVPGEVIQQALERYQAGLPLTTPDAMKEYTDTAYQTALMGPVGGASRLAERSSAISKQEEKDFAEAEKAAQIEADKAKAADEIERAKSYEDQTKADMAGFASAKNEMAEQDTKAKQVEMLLQTDQGTQHLKDNVAFYLPGKTIKDVVAMKKQMTDQATGVGVQGEMFAGPRGQLPTQEEEAPPEVSTEGQGTLFNEKGKPALGAIQVDPLVINEDMLDTWGIPDKNKKLRADLTKYGDLTDPENVAEAKGVLEGYYEKTGKGQEAIAHLDAVDAEHKKLQAQQEQAQQYDQQATDTRSKQLQGQGKPTQEAFQQKAEQVRQKIQDFTDAEKRPPTQEELDGMYAEHEAEYGKPEVINESEGQQTATKDQRKLNPNKPRAVKRVEKPILSKATTPEKAVVPEPEAVDVTGGATNVGTTGVVPSTGKKPSALGETTKAKSEKWFDGVIQRQKEEGWGQDVLDSMEEAGESPSNTAEVFWNKTYPALPDKGKKVFQRMFKNHTGVELKDVDDYPSQYFDLGSKAEDLQGTDRGFVALMHEANSQFHRPQQGIGTTPKKEVPALAPAKGTEVRALGAAAKIWNEESNVPFASLEKDTQQLVKDAHTDNYLNAETITRLEGLDRHNKIANKRSKVKVEEEADKLSNDVFGTTTKTKGKYTAKPESQKPGKVTITKGATYEGEFTEITEKQQAMLEAPVAKLNEKQKATLEKHYGEKRDTPAFFAKVHEDVIKFATKGKNAVAAAIRNIITQIHNGVIAVAMIVNPGFMSQQTDVVAFNPVTPAQVIEMQLQVPPEAKTNMSDAAVEAYQALYPKIKKDLVANDNFMLIMDKPNARMFVFNPDGSLFLQKKVLVGKDVGDLYTGAGKYTPAGLFKLGLRDASRSAAEAKTAGAYTHGKVFVLDKALGGEASVTILHSVWTKETDAQQRTAALKKEGGADSRYSFGCINVDAKTYGGLITHNLQQMDGASLFIVPDNQAQVKDFLSGDNIKDELTRAKIQSSQEGNATKKEESTTTDEINRHLNTLFTPQQLKDNPPTVVATHAELPAHLREAAKKSNSKALVHEGKSYFIASAMRRGEERGTILHEIGAHLGLEKLVGKDRVISLANRVTAWAAQAPTGKAKATNEHLIAKEATEKADLSGEKGYRYQQELIAYFTEIAVNKYKIDPLKGQPKEHGKVAGWLKELWAGIVATLSKLHISPNKLKSADIVDLVYGAARISNTGVKTEGAANIQSSRATASKENSNGQPIHPTEAGVKNFWKWFGDSKATDKEGRPLLLYTGTSKDTDFSTFKVPRNGAWFTTSASDASSYAVTNDSEAHKWDDGKLKAVNRASRVIPVYLRITNPYITSGKDFNAKIFSAAKENYKRGQGIVFDELRQAGHDGILLGGDTWIALDNPSQIKSAIGNTGEYATSNNAILSSIGESLNSMPSASPKLMEDARDALSTVPTALRKAALRFYSIPNMVSQYGGILPSLKKLQRAIEQRDNDGDVRRSIVDNLTHKGVNLLKKYPKQIVRKFNKVAFKLSIANIDPTKDENKDHELVKIYQSLPKPLQDLGNEYAAEYKKHFDEYINILTEMAPEKMGREYLSKVEAMRNDFESKSLAWYHPLRRQGDYWLTYTDKDGESVTISRDSPRAIEREMKLARIKGATDLKQFARLSQIEYDSKAPPSGFIADVLAQMQRGGVKKEVINNTYQMYLSLLPSQSLRQQMQARTGEQGYIEDVVQGFADVGSKMAHQLSAMKYRPDLDNAYAGIHNEAEKDASAAIKDVYEALMAGKSFVENPIASALSSRLSWLSYFMHIAGNASSAFVNLTQLPIIVLPLLAGRYGLGATTAAFNKAFKMYANGKFDDNRGFMPDFTFGKNPTISQEYKDLYEAALDHSTIRRGVGYELTELRRTSAEDYTGMRSKVETGLGWLFQNSERMNREITLIAAYDLARSKMSPEDARAFAINTTVDAHSHALPEAGPQIFQNHLGKIAFTFKRFAQAQIALMAKLFYLTFKGETKEVRDIALKQMMGIYGTTFAFAGVQGIPLYGAASLLLSTIDAMFGDEDEPLDFDERVKLAVGDMSFKGPINQLIGLDIASRTGFNGMVWREDERRLAEVGPGAYIMEHFFGPAYSTLGVNPQRALELFNQGHTDRALETLSPSFIRNPLKAYRFATEGALNRKGAKIVDDVDGLQVFNQILGFTDAELSEAYARAGVRKKIEQHMYARKQSLLDAFYLANTNGDDEMKAKILDNIASFNKAFPVMEISGKTLTQSHKTRVNNLHNSVDGVYIPPKLRATIMKHSGYDEDEED